MSTGCVTCVHETSPWVCMRGCVHTHTHTHTHAHTHTIEIAKATQGFLFLVPTYAYTLYSHIIAHPYSLIITHQCLNCTHITMHLLL